MNKRKGIQGAGADERHDCASSTYTARFDAFDAESSQRKVEEKEEKETETESEAREKTQRQKGILTTKLVSGLPQRL